MVREVYGKNGDKVVVMDVRDLMHGDYAVDVLTEQGDGYRTVYTSPNLEKCIEKAKQLDGKKRKPVPKPRKKQPEKVWIGISEHV